MFNVFVLLTGYSPHLSNFVEFILKNVKNCSSSMQAVEITLWETLRQLKRIFFLIYYFSLPDEGGENKIH